MNIANFSVKNPVLINLLMIGLFLFGGISMLNMPTELNPEIEFNWVFTTVIYTGASPAEIENLIIDPIESEIQDVEDVDEIQSTAGEGIGFVLVKFKDMSDSEFREHYVDLKAEIDKVDLPEETEEPIIDSFGSGDFIPVITVNMAFTIPEDNAHVIADDLEEDLIDMPGVAKVQVSGLAEREIWVEVDPEKMNALNVTFNEIMMALMSRNINVPGGTISVGKTEYFIRALGEYRSVDEIRNTIIRTNPNGLFVKVSDVGNVNDRRKEMTILSRMNEETSITFSISKTGDSNSLDVIEDIKVLIKEYQAAAPDGVVFSFSNDNSVWILRVVNTLTNNAITGMLFIVLVLFLFLGERGFRFLLWCLAIAGGISLLLKILLALAGITTNFLILFSIFTVIIVVVGDYLRGGANPLLAVLGILISFSIAFIFMNITGYSFNGSTLFALVMVLGIIVDDAIIIIENCHRYRLKGFDSIDSAIRGTKEVAAPILSSIATNIAAFLPLMLLPGIMGKFLRIIPIIFSLALVASMFEAFILLPSHYADWTVGSNVYKKGEKKFFRALRKAYGHLLVKVLRRRYWVIGGLIFVLLFSLLLIPIIGVEMFGEEDFDMFWVAVKFPEGTSLDETNRIMKKFEEEALQLPSDHLKNVIVNVGLLQGNEEWLTRKNVAQLFVELKPIEERTKTTDELLAILRDRVQDISGPISLEFEKVTGGPPVGKPISIKVQGKYYDQIKEAALALEDSIRTVDGTTDIMDNSPPGKKEIRIIVDEEKAGLYGFKVQDVALNVRYAFDGVTATEYRDGDDEIDVVVKYDEVNRTSVDDVLNLRLTNPMGQTVALRNMVDFEIKPSDAQIRRFDQKRTIMVTGEIDNNVTSMDKVNTRLAELFPILEKKFPGITFKIGGEFSEFIEVFKDIGFLFTLGLILIFIILGTQFNSYTQPLVILSTVPFALIGAMLGLLISSNPFSIIALFGFVALAGIVVNDAIIMISFINNRRKSEQPTVYQYWRSIVNSGRLRLRPIILTSLTTISGLMPMAFGIGGKSEMWSPLANVILFGLLISTMLTLFVIPSFMAVLDDIKRSRKKARAQALQELGM